MYHRSIFTSSCFVEYLQDIINWRVEPISIKTAEFFKRNNNRVKTTYNHALYEARKLKLGFQKLYADIMFAFGVNKRKFNYKYNKVDPMEERKIRQVREDVFKFIPISIFLIIPGLEILLPPFLVIFPNSLPSQFISEEARLQKF